MNAYRALIDHIVQLLASGDAKVREAVEPLSHQYAAAVAFANERLRRCEAYLREGNRSEAIRECEAEPNLLDLFAVLDFPQRDVWEATVNTHGLPMPERLLAGLAQELNEAYDKEVEVTALLKTHRILALARRPAVERLPVLRSLARTEPNVAHWEEDTRRMEKVRLAEIEQEIDRAFKRRDGERLLALEKELTDTPWLENPPASLSKEVAQCSRVVRFETARHDLDEIATALNAAYAAQDVAGGRRLRASWNAKRRLAELAPADPLVAETADALHWLDEEDAKEKTESDYRQAVAALSAALDGDVSRVEIERLHAAVVRFDREVPDTLLRRAAERLAYLDHAADRKTKLIVAIGVTGVVVAGAVTWFALSRHQFNRRVEGHALNARKLLDDEKLDETSAYLDKLEAEDPAVFHRPEIQRIHSLWNDANQEEIARADAVRILIHCATDSLNRKDWPSLVQARAFTEEASQRAKPGKETDAVTALQKNIEKSQAAIRKQIDDRFDAEFAVWRQKVGGVDRSDQAALLALHDEGEALLKKGKSSVPPVSPYVESSASDLIRKLATWRRTEMERQSAREALAKLDETIGDAAQFSAALERYRSRFERDRDPEQLQARTEADMEALAQTQMLNALLAEAAAQPLSRISVETARQLLQRCTARLSTVDDSHPARAVLERYALVLEPITRRIANDVWITDEVNTVLGKPLILRLQAAVAREDNEIVRYYFRGIPRSPLKDTWSIDAFVDFDMVDTKPVRIDRQNLLNPIRSGADESNPFDWAAPQRRVADMLVERVNRVKLGGDWEREFAGAIQDIDAEPHLEPLLKVQLLDLVAEVAAKGSLFMEEALAPESALLDNVPTDLFDADWIWPHDEDGKNARAKVGMILKQVRPVKTIIEDAARRRKTFEATLDRRLDWIGYLWPDDTSANWTCRPPVVDPSLSGDLFVFVAAEPPPAAGPTSNTPTSSNPDSSNSDSSNSGSSGNTASGTPAGGDSTVPEPPAAPAARPATCVKIGSVSNGKVVLRASHPSAFASGRPVYLHRSTGPHEKTPGR